MLPKNNVIEGKTFDKFDSMLPQIAVDISNNFKEILADSLVLSVVNAFVPKKISNFMYANTPANVLLYAYFVVVLLVVSTKFFFFIFYIRKKSKLSLCQPYTLVDVTSRYNDDIGGSSGDSPSKFTGTSR